MPASHTLLWSIKRVTSMQNEDTRKGYGKICILMRARLQMIIRYSFKKIWQLAYNLQRAINESAGVFFVNGCN